MRTSDQTHAQNRSTFGIAILVVPLACAFWFVATSLVEQWVGDPNYTHGLFVIPMAVLLAWRRRKRVAEIPPEASYLGFAVLATGGLIYMLGIAAAELFTMRFSLVVTVFGLVLLTQGWGRTRELMFPLLFLLL
ncbi:MAG: exosortase/archaeosortase family protein, partial [Candidatus Krumholzibacteria bacterium]|nr:exosortase/archaeosortase family protein [Candidatus Krumholzibacteria bacterium]